MLVKRDMIEQLKLTLPVHLYGIGKAKSFDRLIEEIKAGETQMVFENNLPIRLIQVARVYVFHKEQQLVESKQTIKEQGDRFRNLDCVSEKFKLSESALDAACRGIEEELGLYVKCSDLQSLGKKSEERESPSYPGLMTRYEFYDFQWDMPEKHYLEEGYTADEGDCITFFNWK
jgi:hypothetical protein